MARTRGVRVGLVLLQVLWFAFVGLDVGVSFMAHLLLGLRVIMFVMLAFATFVIGVWTHAQQLHLKEQERRGPTAAQLTPRRGHHRGSRPTTATL